MQYRTHLILVLSCTILLTSFTRKEKKELALIINKVVIDLEYILSEDWYIVPNEVGFNVNYCPTCMEKYKAWSDSTNTYHSFNRSDIYQKFGPDSVYIYSMVSAVRTTKEEHYLRVVNNGILQFKVEFAPKSDSTEINRVQAKNEALVEAIFSKPVYKTDKRQFDDYRKYIPKNYWKDRTEHLGYTEFERLPYSSMFYDYSIFIDFGNQCYGCRLDYIVSKDQETKSVKLKYLDKNIFQTQLMLTYVLGIPDFITDERDRHRTFHSDLKSDIELR